MKVIQKSSYTAVEKKMTTRIIFLPFVMGPVFKQLDKFVGEYVVAEPYSIYYNIIDKNLDCTLNNSAFKMMFTKLQLAMGIPVKSTFDDAILHKLPGFEKVFRPASKYVSHILNGSYGDLGKAHNKNLQYIKDHNLNFAGETLEIYLNDPRSTPKSELKTEVLAKIAD